MFERKLSHSKLRQNVSTFFMKIGDNSAKFQHIVDFGNWWSPQKLSIINIDVRYQDI